MRLLVGLAASLGLLLGGCPSAQNIGGDGPVTAVIAITSTEGQSAPFLVVVAAGGSTSTNPGALTYNWDFGDGVTSTSQTETHTFTRAGAFLIRLRVTDSTGASGVATVTVRVRGGDAVAVIGADTDSGPAPLTVQFDGTASQGVGDTIRDYYWDFDDGTTSRATKPRHTFYAQGEYRVTLRVVTSGGVEAQTFATILVGERQGSLQFSGSQFATLSLGNSRTLPEATLEAWVSADNEGGTVLILGAGVLAIEVVPASNTIRLRAQSTQTSAAATNLTGVWRHVAAVYRNSTTSGGGEGGTVDPNAPLGATCTLYLDGSAIGAVNVNGNLTFDGLTVGNGMRGKVAEIRVWGSARTQTEVRNNLGRRVAGGGANLLGAWPCDEGSGQTLRNVQGGTSGLLGSTNAVEAADPAWSSDSPPI